MSEITQRNLGANLAAYDYSADNAFLFNNTVIEGSYTNSSGSEVTLAKYTIMGRNNTTGLFEPLDSDESTSYDGTMGILTEEQVVADGATVNISLVNGGEVRESALVLTNEDDTLESVVDGNRIRDILIMRTVGLTLKGNYENTKTDN